VGKDGKKFFQGATRGDRASHELLRRELEKVDTELLFSRALSIGVSPSNYDYAFHCVKDERRHRITELIMEIARREGEGWGPLRQPEGVVRGTYVVREIAMAKKKAREGREREREAEERLIAARFKAANQYAGFQERTARKGQDREATMLRESMRFSNPLSGTADDEQSGEDEGSIVFEEEVGGD
jgi:hypothetical protein